MANRTIIGEQNRWVLAILFAALFASISWIAPATYLAVSPADNQMQIQSVNVEQTSNTTHNLTIEYQSQDRYPIEAQITLYKDQNESDIASESWTTSSVIPAGENKQSLTLDVAEPIANGTYYYEFDIRVHVGYNVEKEYTYTTDSFPVTNSSAPSADVRTVNR